MNNNKQNKIYRYINIGTIIVSSIIRLIYIIITPVGTRQHDLGYATRLDDGLINPGHLGYVEYIAKFHHLPDFDPFSIFSYYHPPVHHIIASFFLTGGKALGINEPKLYELIQIPCLIYSILTIIITYYTFKLFSKNEKYIIIPLLFVALNPGLIYMTGSINNDMFATMLAFLAVYLSIKWIVLGYKNRHLFEMALCIGFGMIVKPNVVVLAAPMAIVMLMHFIDEIKAGRLKNCIGKYCIFALLSIPIGLSWTIRNIIRFGVTPGVPASNPLQYYGDYPLWELLGIPVKSAIAFPFHAEKAAYCHNAWQILIKTMLFTEIWPIDISKPMLLLCQVLYVSSFIIIIALFISSIAHSIIRIKKGDTAVGSFLLSGIITVFITYIMFILKYPSTCSCDFRYVAVSLLFFGISIIPISSKE